MLLQPHNAISIIYTCFNFLSDHTGKKALLYCHKPVRTLLWRHNERTGVTNHQCLPCWLKCFIRHISKKTWKLRVTGLCEGNSPMTGEFLTQRASNAENVSIWWRHLGKSSSLLVLSDSHLCSERPLSVALVWCIYTTTAKKVKSNRTWTHVRAIAYWVFTECFMCNMGKWPYLFVNTPHHFLYFFSLFRLRFATVWII